MHRGGSEGGEMTRMSATQTQRIHQTQKQSLFHREASLDLPPPGFIEEKLLRIVRCKSWHECLNF